MEPAPASAAADAAEHTAPAPPKGLSGALTRFRIMAFTTGVVLAFMTCIGMPYKFITQETTTWYSLGWMAHGWLYIAYVAVTLDLVFRLRWHLGRALLILLAGTIPFMSFVAEHYVTKRVRPMLAAASVQPASVQR
jgi:integral membrane protein